MEIPGTADLFALTGDTRKEDAEQMRVEMWGRAGRADFELKEERVRTPATVAGKLGHCSLAARGVCLLPECSLNIFSFSGCPYQVRPSI